MFLPRSRVDEANPVVGGRSDAETANVVFPGWRSDEPLQQKFNPFVELIEARKMRDLVLRRFVLKPGDLTGAPTKDLARVGQTALAKQLAVIRKWPKASVERYFGITIPDDEWTGFYAKGVEAA